MARAPYDLLIANILAGPLVELAPSFASVVADGGSLILAGLLNTQVDKVVAAYRRNGFFCLQNARIAAIGLVFASSKGGAMAIVGRSAHRGAHQPPGDFGTW